MLKALRFVQGAVAKKDYTPILTHFRIHNGFIRSYNGILSLCSPIPLDINANPTALGLLKVIRACDNTIAINLTPKGRLSVKSGNFQAFVDCTEETFPEINPEGPSVDLQPGLLSIIKQLTPLTAQDASRPWAQGILFRGNSAYVTNNVVLAERWLGYTFPVEINVPQPALLEMLRINEDPIRMQATDKSCTFHYANNRWLHSTTYSVEWPDVSRVLEHEHGAIQDIPNELWVGAHKMLPFVDDFEVLWLSPNRIHTHCEADVGASDTVEGLNVDATIAMNIKHLLLLEGVAKQIAFTKAPRPSMFYGENIRGAILGMSR